MFRSPADSQSLRFHQRLNFNRPIMLPVDWLVGLFSLNSGVDASFFSVRCSLRV